jgi:hypothetical protein
VATHDELLAQAAALDAEAIAAHSDDRPQAVLRRQAAELRVEALGPKPYPVLICSSCFHLTGWLSADGLCAPDLRHRRHVSADWPRIDPERLVLLPTESGPLLRRVRRTLGMGSRRDRARAWLSRVEPGETGPVAPEEGWELEVAVKYEQEAPEGHDLLVYFDAASLRFEYGAWRPVDDSHNGKPRRLGPRELPASLPVAALVEAWTDFVQEVADHNHRVWHAEATRRVAHAAEMRARHEAAELQRGTSDLLG